MNIPDLPYADGQAIRMGDIVLYDGGLYPADIVNFIDWGDGSFRVSLHAVKAGGKVELCTDHPGRLCLVARKQGKKKGMVMQAALDHLQELAEGGDAHALYALGNLHIRGIGLPSDLDAGKALWQRAAVQDHAEAMYQLGLLCEKADLEAALALWRKSAECGYAPAQTRTGRALRAGEGGVRSTGQAVAWFLKAAAQDHAAAYTQLGMLHASGDGLAHDEAKAVACWRKAAELGDGEGQYLLGCRYESGLGIKADPEQAMRWYQASYGQQCWLGCFNLARLYERAVGIDRHLYLAQVYYKVAADEGDAEAMLIMGKIFKEGRGVAVNREEALRWFKRAVRKGHPLAKASVAAMKAEDSAIP